jgi:DNA-binding NarL/FixJ family response regulator
VNTRILLADDHEMVRAGLGSILQRQKDFEVVGEAGDGIAAVDLARQLVPHVVIMDVSMPLLNGVEATRQIIALDEGIRVIALSVHYDRTIVAEILRAGASAYLLKNSAAIELTLALKAVREGNTYLSPKVSQLVVTTFVCDGRSAETTAFTALTAKQREVLQLLAEGKTNKEIGSCLCISTKTVEAHRAQLMEKLRIHTIAGLTKYAIREGLTSLEV